MQQLISFFSFILFYSSLLLLLENGEKNVPYVNYYLMSTQPIQGVYKSIPQLFSLK